MGSSSKFTHHAMTNIMRHIDRSILEPSNVDIDPERTHLNYSFEMDHGGLTDYEYYKKLLDDKYLYGRGSKREDKAITGCGWVVTAPNEISGDPVKEKEFFQGVFDFISDRYGKENILFNSVHLDEAGKHHIHVVFCPVTELDHTKVQYKIIRTKEALKMPSGRYEFGFKYKLDGNGQKIKVSNYSRLSDYYDQKISANDVLNKIELKNFHKDLQRYLDTNGIEGKVVTGKTGGVNFSVKELKEFTAKTGLRLDEVKEMQGDRSLLESYVEQHSKVNTLEELLNEKNAVIESLKEEIMAKDRIIEATSDMRDEITHKDDQIRKLTNEITNRDKHIAAARHSNMELQQTLKDMELQLSEKDRTLDQSNNLTKNELLHKEEEIINLKNTISEKDLQITKVTDINTDLQQRLKNMEVALSEKQHEIDLANEKIKDLEKHRDIEATRTEKEHGWGHNTGAWGDRSQSWGTHTTEIEEEKTW